jgi:hypothetical protein
MITIAITDLMAIGIGLSLGLSAAALAGIMYQIWYMHSHRRKELIELPRIGHRQLNAVIAAMTRTGRMRYVTHTTTAEDVYTIWFQET